MKSITKIIYASLITVLLFAACNKVEDLPFYNTGTAANLTASSATVAPAVADSSKTVVSFNWTNPKYATDSSTVKYVIQIDSTGKNFSNPYFTRTVTGSNSVSLTGAQITSLLVARGLNFNTLYAMDVKVTSSYANNNENLVSNVLTVRMSAYVTPPKIALPITGKLFIVGDATQGGWNNPVPAPVQQLGKVDSVTYVGVFNMNANKEFLILPENGSWDNKFSLQTNNLPGVSESGDFGFNLPSNFKGPAVGGWFKLTLDFQRGKYKIEPYTGAKLPDDLFIVGDATPGGWNNPVPTPSQKFTRLNSIEFSLASLTVNVNKEYLLLPVNGDWSNKYAVGGSTNATPAGGFFGYNLNDNFKGPVNAGNYKLDINFGIQQKDAAGLVQPNTAMYKNTKL